MRELLVESLHLAAVALHLVSAVLLLLARRGSRAATSTTGRPALRVLPGGLSTQREVARG
ncbi:hypothetical protein [Corallococcus carmarthensis]|uniref:Uncharacterized protein n=1 Tax=Corallococcus carmarthensis TaxID=2316728 RepID=A0A3A8KKK2_9BACT|nr:hypothetical protein [Corallococcus carmarthensis]RKH02972.1 hypothetical protein D7X32_15290 [Corallococcus carmarthensis]